MKMTSLDCAHCDEPLVLLLLFYVRLCVLIVTLVILAVVLWLVIPNQIALNTVKRK